MRETITGRNSKPLKIFCVGAFVLVIPKLIAVKLGAYWLFFFVPPPPSKLLPNCWFPRGGNTKGKTPFLGVYTGILTLVVVCVGVNMFVGVGVIVGVNIGVGVKVFEGVNMFVGVGVIL